MVPHGRRAALAVLLTAGLFSAGCAGTTAEGPRTSAPRTTVPRASASAPVPPSASTAATPRKEAPALDVEVVTDRLTHGWDLAVLPDGKILVSERPGRLSLVSSGRAGARVTRVDADLSEVYARSEGGLMGLTLTPDFEQSRRFITCHVYARGGDAVDVRLVTWRLSADGTAATRVGDLLTGLPVNPSGRHSGCRPTLDADDALLVGTGDTARGAFPQDRSNLGGKTLRLDPATGEPWPGNPFAGASGRERYVYTYGHRTLQGVAVRADGSVFTAEHGPTIDDEINLLVAGANYGWDPARGGTRDGYDESVPMTDTDRYPDAVGALWSSGRPTVALAGAAFLEGEEWGAWDGALAVATLKASKLMVFTLDAAGGVTDTAVPSELDQPYGRLRAARTGPDGALYLTTSNGTDDKLLRVTPRE